MPENPLLPNSELRALHALLQHVSALHSSQEVTTARGRSPSFSLGPGTEAVLSSTLLQLQAGDVIFPEPGEVDLPSILAGRRFTRAQKPPGILQVTGGSSRLFAAAGIAAGLRRTGEGRLVLAFSSLRLAEERWREALAWAQEDKLPLILVCVDKSGADAFRDSGKIEPEAISWQGLQQVSEKTQLPALAVDGQDAVAMYRVVQESVLRARALAGPVAIWAVLPTEKELRRPSKISVSPLNRLEKYLQVRKISFRSR